MVMTKFIVTTPSHTNEDDDGTSALQSHQDLSEQVRVLVEGGTHPTLRTTFDTERSPDEFRGAFSWARSLQCPRAGGLQHSVSTWGCSGVPDG